MNAGNESSLNGITVLVTRPEGQGGNLCRLVETAGGRAVSFPVIVIRTLDDAETRRQLHAVLTGCDAVIFVSRNAVRCAWMLSEEPVANLEGKMVLAAGAGTARELKMAGVDGVIHTEATRASENLLDRPELSVERIGGRHVGIIRGEGGRELLSEELQRRGATVRPVAVYRRELPQVAPDKIDALWHDSRPDVIVITSVAGLQNLVELTPQARRPELYSTRLAVMSERIAGEVQTLGFTIKPVVAAGASDEELIRAVAACME